MSIQEIRYTFPNIPQVTKTQSKAIVEEERDGSRSPSTATVRESDGRKQNVVASANKQAKRILSGAEQAFFEQLFPQATDEIRLYETYERNGHMDSSQLGTVIDKKG